MFPIAFVTTCKGRLHHIKQTLPTLVALKPAEIIVVDYSCPDGTADWVEANYPEVRVVRVNDDPGFCLPRARNMGAAHSSAPWLCFIDADILVEREWLGWMEKHLKPSRFYRPSLLNGAQLQEVAGTFLCTREAFETCKGYDEAFRGWGGEDIDLYTRLPLEAGAQLDYYPNEFVKPISHADDERTTFHAIKNIRIQSLINGCYVKVKRHLLENSIRDIPFETRRSMLSTLSDYFKSFSDQPRTFAVRLQALGLTDSEGRRIDLEVEVSKQRRFGFFGARKSSVRTLKSSI
jgi:glycosyltransferase involved in cell wall biosynthesis